MALTLNTILLLGLGIVSAVWSLALVAWVVYFDSSQRAKTTRAMDHAFRTILGELGEQRRMMRASSIKDMPAE